MQNWHIPSVYITYATEKIFSGLNFHFSFPYVRTPVFFCPQEATLFLWRIHAETAVHYDDVIMGTIASQITSLTIVYSTLYSGADQSKHQSSASLAFVWGIHRGPVNYPHKRPVTRKMFPFDDVIMCVMKFVHLICLCTPHMAMGSKVNEMSLYYICD